MNIMITISGSGGGSKGPQGIYTLFHQKFNSDSVKFLPVDAEPNQVSENVERVSKIALECLRDENIYLIGHSMGGAVAALAAFKLKGIVKGLVLLNTQTDGLSILKELDIPILFYHGTEDQIFPLRQIESLFRKYAGPKRIVKIAGLNHDLDYIPNKSKVDNIDLATDLFGEITAFFFHRDERSTEGEIISRNITPIPKETVLTTVASFFKSFLKIK